MLTTFQCLVVLFFFSTGIHFHIYTDHLTARLTESVKLFCSVIQADDLQAIIFFMRRIGYKTENCGQIMQKRNECLIDTEDRSQYRLYCDYGTNWTQSLKKIYRFEIQSMKQEDFAEWWCQTKSHPQDYNTVILNQPSK